MSSGQFVYFIKPVGRKGPIKIGVSWKPLERLSGLMAWSPVKLEIIATIEGTCKLEHNIHACFADCHSHREWFHPAPRLLAAIEKIAAGIPVEEAINLQNKVGSIRKRGKASREFTASDRKYLSYAARIRNVRYKQRIRPPKDIDAILHHWSLSRKMASAAELARLDTFLSDPRRYGLPYFREVA